MRDSCTQEAHRLSQPFYCGFLKYQQSQWARLRLEAASQPNTNRRSEVQEAEGGIAVAGRGRGPRAETKIAEYKSSTIRALAIRRSSSPRAPYRRDGDGNRTPCASPLVPELLFFCSSVTKTRKRKPVAAPRRLWSKHTRHHAAYRHQTTQIEKCSLGGTPHRAPRSGNRQSHPLALNVDKQQYYRRGRTWRRQIRNELIALRPNL